MSDRLSRLLETGWAGIEGIAERNASEQARRQREAGDMAELVARVFGTDEGRKVLAWLCDRTVNRPSIPPSVVMAELGTFEQVTPHVVFREGQNAVVAMILNMIVAASRPKEQGP